MSTKPAMTETIEWFDANEVQPDEGITVLLFVPAYDITAWPGYCETVDDELIWRWADGSRVDHKMPNNVVTHWAEMPGGPHE